MGALGCSRARGRHAAEATVALLLLLGASCGGQRAPFASAQVLTGFEGSAALIPAGGFSPDGERLVLSAVDASARRAQLSVFGRSGLGWRLVAARLELDGGSPSQAWLTDTGVVVGVSGVGALAYALVDGGLEPTTVAEAHGELTGVSNDGLVLSSSHGVARWSGAAWVDESRIVGVVTADGQRVVTASVDGGSLLGTGPNLTLTSHVPRGGGWAVETSSTLRPFGDTPILSAPLLEVSRDGSLAAVRVQVPVTGQPLTTTVVLLYARRADGWVFHSRQAGPSVGGRGLSADGRVLAFGGGSELTQVRLVEALGRPGDVAILRGTHLALGPDGDTVAVWRPVAGGALFQVFER